MIDNSTKFRAAHIIAKNTIRDGDDYRTTFAAALRLINRWISESNDAADLKLDRPNIKIFVESTNIWKGCRLYLNLWSQNKFRNASVYLDLNTCKVVVRGDANGARNGKIVSALLQGAEWAEIESVWQ